MKQQETTRKTIISLIMLISLVTVGTVGYSILLEISFLEALYTTIVTISTVGNKDIPSTSAETMGFTIFLILWGVALVGYAFSSILMLIIDGRIQAVWRGKMLGNKISKLDNHYILCGCGETGDIIVEEFINQDSKFVVIESNLEKCQKLMSDGILTIHGDATQEAVLLEARVEFARGLVSTMPTDTDNIVSVLTARTLNKDIYIISKAYDKHSPQKLKIAGADKSLLTTSIEGRRMAALLLKPNIVSFLDVVTRIGDVEFNIESVEVKDGSNLCGLSLKEARIPNKTGLIVFAVQQHTDGKMVFNPSSSFKIEPADSLIVMGSKDQIESLERLVEAE